ncbi:restriction endonuclease subunit S [Campylobacter jejuni]|uniref:restriction endonuclease subunit S n=1 Tax=Campylobacter jejuni TaxID=197 RepID=UPI000F7FB79C|nr:restriction endonuclease subunit S [Campylobacter jejuni]RTJ14412.1 restriction endonuclease subunit S [Campylobacter jejuni]
MKNFKDSGIEWLGEIPEHWKIKPLKAVFHQRNEQNTNLELHAILSLIKDVGVVPYEEKGNIGNKSKEDLQSYKIARINDLILNKMNAVIGSLGVSAYNGLVSPIYLVFYINSPKYLMSYYSYLFQIKNVQKFLKIYAYGIMEIRESIDYLDFKKMSLPVPPLKEQEQIANFLDEKCKKIANFIEKKEKLITLLKEQKQALINETITKGLDKNINFKDSGIEHLGEIPQHWKIVKLKYLGSFQNGISINSEAFGAGYPFVSYGDIYNNICIPYNIKGLVNSTEIDRKIYSVKQGDIFFTRTSETIDEIGISSVCLKTIENAVFAGFLIRFRADKKVLDNNFAKFYFRRSFNQSFFAKENGLVTRASLSQELLGRLSVVIPPLKEQEQIANFLDEKCKKIDLLIEKTEKQIKLIKEYKTTLINQAVCGRINL